MSTPSWLSIAAAGRLMDSGALTSLALTESCLEQIRRYEERVHAWVTVAADGARATAKALDAERRAGKCRGPLHGIPLGIKDIVDVAGWPTLAGSRLRAGHVAARDSAIVARLRAAGAVILGKTVTTEFACFDPPVTRNPWNLDRTPGGSSSGSCAAVALGMCLGAIGSQTGGSITRPAAYCGVAGCKPTYGRVSTAGVVPISFHLDHPGVIARQVADLAIMLAAIADYDPQDPHSTVLPEFHVGVDQPVARPPRVATLQGFFVEQASTAVRQTFDQALARLAAAGADIVPVAPPSSFAGLIDSHRRIMAVDAATYHRDQFPARRAEFSPCIARLLEDGNAISALDYAAALAHQLQFARDVENLLHDFDALLTPAATDTAPGLDTTGDPRFNAPFSASGSPTVSHPCGLAVDGLPVGLQWVGRRGQEAELLAVARWSEQILGLLDPPALLAETARVD